MARAIKIIPATKDKFTAMPTASIQKRRVAGYARVSTDSDEQFTSYEAQIDYYTQYIKKRDDWTFVKVYTDEGISGTNTKRRDGFNQMVADALDGKIDLIVTKSVSRFARNTVDSLTTVRTLKEHGVEVFFEKENIYTFDSKGELLITIMSSLAQEESRSISENVTWGQRKRFADGKVSMPYKRFLGYDRGENGQPIINEEEAKVVRLIYSLFLQGKTSTGICRHLEGLGILTPSGKKTWSQTTVTSILQNEKYKGDALLQKKFTVDFLTKKQKVNEGEVPQYYVEGSHEAIITPLEFDMVQAEIARRKKLGKNYSGTTIFSSKLICADCGGYYGKKVWHSNDPYRTIIWQCNGKFKGPARCTTPTLREEIIQDMFMRAYTQLIGSRNHILTACEITRETLCDCTELDERIDALNEEIQVIANMVSQCIKENASTQMTDEEYQRKYNRLVRRYDAANKQLTDCIAQRDQKASRDRELRIFSESLSSRPAESGPWDEQLWISLLDTGRVHKDGSITFRFKNGTEIAIQA